MTDDLEELLRYERGDLAQRHRDAVSERLAADAAAREWLDWIGALRRLAESPAAAPEHAGPAPDPIEVAALAEGTLSADRIPAVREALAQCDGGYEMLAIALEETRALRVLPAEPRPQPNRWRWLAAAALVFAALGAWSLSRETAGGPDLRSLAVREALSVPTLRSSPATEGLRAYRDGDFAAAADALASTVANDADDGQAWLYLGSARLLVRDDAGAADALDKARSIAKGSFHAEATWQLVQARLALGERERARAALADLEGSHRADEAAALLERIDGAN